jgi:hypothetical protein
MGVGQARNRLPRAVESTVPFGMLVQSLVVVWYAVSGYRPEDITARREAEPWHGGKSDPSSEDMIVKLRKALIVAGSSGPCPAQQDPRYRATRNWPGPQPPRNRGTRAEDVSAGPSQWVGRCRVRSRRRSWGGLHARWSGAKSGGVRCGTVVSGRCGTAGNSASVRGRCLPVSGSSSIILIPVRKDPKDSHQRPEGPTSRSGSIAL